MLLAFFRPRRDLLSLARAVLGGLLPSSFRGMRAGRRAPGGPRGGGTVQRSLEEQYPAAAIAPEQPKPTAPLSTPLVVNPNREKQRPFDEALYLVAAATPTAPEPDSTVVLTTTDNSERSSHGALAAHGAGGARMFQAATPTAPEPTTGKKLGEQLSAAIEKLTTPTLRSTVALATTDIFRRTSAAIERLTTPKLDAAVTAESELLRGPKPRPVTPRAMEDEVDGSMTQGMGQQLRDLEEEFEGVICTELPVSVQPREHRASVRLRPDWSGQPSHRRSYKVVPTTTDILGSSSRSPAAEQPVRDSTVVLTTTDNSERSSHGALAAHGAGGRANISSSHA
ncbi:hypothetical protein CYMTET_42603 [Cymbomonas tetramitiformis]|uniref:Uncharacterized protein n=1 Tax=Cymbomonas tetramitiformis TaxID=36881 RepID=A0AAE0F1I5_9CHLO|nr:hypothetical protein CYMTET_42603 [Cymbomonas tetramitiformis]